MFAREKVFVSYANENQEFVEKNILPALERANRDRWFAPRDISFGDIWRTKLFEGLQSCDRLLVVVSKDAEGSDWVKTELDYATKPLLEKKVKLDARRVHRAILPVKLEMRGRFGEILTNASGNVSEPSKESEVDLYKIHPYLTLVNFLSFPFNKELDDHVNSKGEFEGDVEGLTEEQRSSIRTYAADRETAQKHLIDALRVPDRLRWGFHPLGRLLALLGSPVFQRAALALGLILSTILLLQKLDRGVLFLQTLHGGDISRIDIQTGTNRIGSVASKAFPVDLSNGPVDVHVLATMTNGKTKDAWISLGAQSSPQTLRRDSQVEVTSYLPDRSGVKDAPDSPNHQPPKLVISADPSRAYSDDGTHTIDVGSNEVTLIVRAKGETGLESTKTVLIRPATISNIDKIEIGHIVRNDEGKLRADNNLALLEEQEHSHRVPTIDLAGKEGLQIVVTNSDGESTRRFVLCRKPNPPSLEYWDPHQSRWREADNVIPTISSAEPSRLQLRASTGRAEQTAYVELPARPSRPTIEVKTDARDRWTTAYDGIERALSGEPHRLYIRARASDRENTTFVNLIPPPSPDATPEISVSVRGLQTGNLIQPIQRYVRRSVYQLAEPSEIAISATTIGGSADEKIQCLVPSMPDIQVTVPPVQGQTVFANVQHSVGQIHIAPEGGPAIPPQEFSGYRPIGANAYQIAYNGRDPLVFTVTSPDGITARSTLVPVFVQVPDLPNRPQRPPYDIRDLPRSGGGVY